MFVVVWCVYLFVCLLVVGWLVGWLVGWWVLFLCLFCWLEREFLADPTLIHCQASGEDNNEKIRMLQEMRRASRFSKWANSPNPLF